MEISNEQTPIAMRWRWKDPDMWSLGEWWYHEAHYYDVLSESEDRECQLVYGIPQLTGALTSETLKLEELSKQNLAKDELINYLSKKITKLEAISSNNFEQCGILYEKLTEAQNVCGEAYQVVGALSEAVGCFETKAVEKCLDNLADARMVHDDVLPFIVDHGGYDYFNYLVFKAKERAEKAMQKFPQPNYVLNKLAEEHGEVVKAAVHYTEGRETWQNVEGELIDNLAMLIRLVVEGDQVIGFIPPQMVDKNDDS